MRFVLLNMTGGKAERDKLNYYIGDHAARARILAEDSFLKYGDIDGLLCVGMSDFQMRNAVDSFMAARGFKKLIHPQYKEEKQAFRFTCLTVAYVKSSLNPIQIVYDDSAIDTIYRYAAFQLQNGLIIRVLHVPAADQLDSRYEEKLIRKQKMLLFEHELENKAEEKHQNAIVVGDFNTEPGNLNCHDIYDRLPFEKLLDEPTWRDKKLDNVLISTELSGKVNAYTGDYRLGQTSDHKAVIIEVNL